MSGDFFFPHGVQSDKNNTGNFSIMLGEDDKYVILAPTASPEESQDNLLGCDQNTPHFIIDPSSHSGYPFRFCVILNRSVGLWEKAFLEERGKFLYSLPSTMKEKILDCIERHGLVSENILEKLRGDDL